MCFTPLGVTGSSITTCSYGNTHPPRYIHGWYTCWLTITVAEYRLSQPRFTAAVDLPDIVLISPSSLLYNHLRVVEDEQTEDHDAHVDLNLKEEVNRLTEMSQLVTTY